MAGLSVIFKAVDEISGRFESMANAGRSVLAAFEEIEGSANAAFSNIDKGTEDVSSSVERTADGLKRYCDRMEAASEAAGGHRDASGRLVDANGQLADSVDAAAHRLDAVPPKLKAVSSGMEECGKEGGEAGRQMEGFGQSAAESLQSLNEALVSVGIVYALKQIADAFKDCSDAAAGFETKLAMVSTVSDTSALSMGQMAGQIGALSRGMARDVNDLSESSYNAISAGVDTVDAVETVGKATKLSEAGFTSVASSLSVLTTSMNAYHMGAEELTGVSDSLVMTQNLGVLTIDQLSRSMGKAISTASAYNIDIHNLEGGYIGLTKAGIGVDEATTYLSSMFNELGSAGSDVSDILLEQTGRSFGQLMDDGYSLADVLEILYESVGRDGEALMNLWGSAEAGKASNAIVSQGLVTFNENLEKLGESAGATERAYQTMTGTTEFSTRRMGNSFRNLEIAIGGGLNPAVRGLQNGVADAVDALTGLIQRHPAIAAVLTGLTVGFGAVAVGIVGYAAVTKLAAIATTALGGAINVALGPIALIGVAIAAVASGVVYYAKEMEEAADVESHLTASSQKMADELAELKARQEELAGQQEDGSGEAEALQRRIDELTESYEANKTTIGDLISQTESLSTSIEKARQNYEDTVEANGQLERGSEGLISQLMILSSKTDITNTDLKLMQGIVDKLNGSYEGLGLTLDATSGKLNLSAGDLYKAVSQAADEANRKAAVDGLMGVMQQFQDAQEIYEKTEKASDEAFKKLQELEKDWKSQFKDADATRVGVKPSMDLITAQKDYDALAEAAENARMTYDGLISDAEKYSEALGMSSEETAELIERMKEGSSEAGGLGEVISSVVRAFGGEDWLGAAQEAIDGVKPRVEELTTAYEQAYAAARTSIEGQIGLFEVMKTECSQSTDDMLKAFESQIEYLNNYAENIQKAQEYGLDADLIAKLSDGSMESAGQLDAIISKVEELGTTTEEAQAFVGEFNTSFEGVNTAKDTFSEAVADMQAGFSLGMNKIITDLVSAVEKMDMSSEAKSSASATINAYINEVRRGVELANAEWSKLKFPSPGGGGKPGGGYATGTYNARPGLAKVGENGPEIVDFSGGEVVYTATETDNILSRRRSGEDLFIPPPAEPIATGEKGDRTIVLKLEGAGELRVDKNTNKNEVVDWMAENMRDVLLEIVQQEILEEGDMAYEF